MPRSTFGGPSPTRPRSALTLSVFAATLLVAACDSPLAPALALALSQPRVEFEAVRGSSTPLMRTINVSNTGGGRLGPVTCTAAPAAWLTCAVTDGNVLTLTANPAGLTSSPSDAVVDVNAAGISGSTQLTVGLEILNPVLSLSANSAEFSSPEGGTVSPAQRQLTVSNAGQGGLAGLGAISCVPEPANPRVSCSVDQSTGTVTVGVSGTGLSAGTYVYPVSVRAANSATPAGFSVVLSVSAPPRISASPSALHFTAPRGATTSQSSAITVTNSGSGSLGTLTCSAPATWLGCSVSGSTITVTANATGLATSPLAGAVSISAAGAANSPVSVPVTFAIEQPVLALTQNTASFAATFGVAGTTPTAQSIGVQNVGAGTIANLGTISCTPQTGSPLFCTVNQSNGILTLTASTTNLNAGVFTYPVTVSASNAAASQTLLATITVTGQPSIVFSQNPVTINVPTGSTTQVVRTVTVTNGGGGELGTLTCTPNPAVWLTCSVSGNTLVLTASPGGMVTAPAPAGVTVTASNIPNSPAFLTVQLTIQQQLAVDQASLAFSASAGGQPQAPAGTVTTPGSAVITVTNASGGTLAALGTIQCTPGAQMSCTVNQTTGQVTVVASAVGLPPGTYGLGLVISAANASNAIQIPVTLTVSP